MGEEYSRRQKPQLKQRKNNYFFVILFSIINLAALTYLLFLNVQAESKFNQQLTTIEQYVRQFDQQVASRIATVSSSNSGLPETGQATTNQTTPPAVTQTQASVDEEPTTSSSTEKEANQTIELEPEVILPTSYTVQVGDSLSVIAEKNNLSLQDLMIKNNLTDSTVYIGQVLMLR